MRQSDSVSEELDTENVQCALDFENTMNELETQLYYRHLPPKEVALRVMEAACKFYDADWCGLIQVDLDLGLWKPLWWHNECQEDKTTILTNEFESSEFLDRWVKAVRRGTPMVVSDAEDVKDTYPDEYRLYERLGIKSVLAIPLEPRQIALIAVRNPQRYTHQTSMLKLLAYVLLAAYNDKRMADSLSMAFSPENIKSSHDVFISLFGESASKFVRPGSVRIASTAPGDRSVSICEDEQRPNVFRTNVTEHVGVAANVAFRTPDGRIVLVAANDSWSRRSIRIQYNGRFAELELEPGAAGTFVWDE